MFGTVPRTNPIPGPKMLSGISGTIVLQTAPEQQTFRPSFSRYYFSPPSLSHSICIKRCKLESSSLLPLHHIIFLTTIAEGGP